MLGFGIGGESGFGFAQDGVGVGFSALRSIGATTVNETGARTYARAKPAVLNNAVGVARAANAAFVTPQSAYTTDPSLAATEPATRLPAPDPRYAFTPKPGTGGLELPPDVAQLFAGDNLRTRFAPAEQEVLRAPLVDADVVQAARGLNKSQVQTQLDSLSTPGGLNPLFDSRW